MVLQIATVIAVYANWSFARIKGCGWGWAGVIWLYSVVFYIPLDLMKFAIRYILSGKAWVNMLENKVCIEPLCLKYEHILFSTFKKLITRLLIKVYFSYSVYHDWSCKTILLRVLFFSKYIKNLL